jgi:hypothetical protein
VIEEATIECVLCGSDVAWRDEWEMLDEHRILVTTFKLCGGCGTVLDVTDSTIEKEEGE